MKQTPTKEHLELMYLFQTFRCPDSMIQARRDAKAAINACNEAGLPEIGRHLAKILKLKSCSGMEHNAKVIYDTYNEALDALFEGLEL